MIIFMFRFDQVKVEACLLAAYTEDRFEDSLARNPLRNVLLWVSVKTRGKKLLRQMALVASAFK